jgi:hypothetical protein
MADTSEKVISTILKHDAKITSYKIALLRAINDVVLTYPDMRNHNLSVAIPLRHLASYWMAYYWPFVSADSPILQGQRARLGNELRNDMAFRPNLTRLRIAWDQLIGGRSRPSDGFFLISEMRVRRRRAILPEDFVYQYEEALKVIARTLEMPIRYAGPGEWTVFERPVSYKSVQDLAIAIPGTREREKCLVVNASLWETFRHMSLWVEALCIHEWCLFSERKSEQMEGSRVGRGEVYQLLTDRPDNRRPLTWERNQIDLLIMEGGEFICPWTEKRIRQDVAYDLDHLVPLAIYPTNEMWNLVPSNPYFNSHKKRDRLPTSERLEKAQPHLATTYNWYKVGTPLGEALREDVELRFSTIKVSETNYPEAVSLAVVDLINQVAESRNVARF